MRGSRVSGERVPTAGENAGTSPLDGAAEEGGGVKMGRVRRLRRHPRGPSDSPSAVHGSRSGSDISDCIPSAGLPLDCPWTAPGLRVVTSLLDCPCADCLPLDCPCALATSGRPGEAADTSGPADESFEFRGRGGGA